MTSSATGIEELQSAIYTYPSPTTAPIPISNSEIYEDQTFVLDEIPSKSETKVSRPLDTVTSTHPTPTSTSGITTTPTPTFVPARGDIVECLHRRVPAGTLSNDIFYDSDDEEERFEFHGLHWQAVELVDMDIDEQSNDSDNEDLGDDADTRPRRLRRKFCVRVPGQSDIDLAKPLLKQDNDDNDGKSTPPTQWWVPEELIRPSQDPTPPTDLTALSIGELVEVRGYDPRRPQSYFWFPGTVVRGITDDGSLNIKVRYGRSESSPDTEEDSEQDEDEEENEEAKGGKGKEVNVRLLRRCTVADTGRLLMAVSFLEGEMEDMQAAAEMQLGDGEEEDVEAKVERLVECCKVIPLYVEG
ncbi:hypothetical protein HK102_006733 [Quaeritorhiza haematococci]|nr:hypothetical protein HK102_006733 [Quaeritorhiza haematococci]